MPTVFSYWDLKAPSRLLNLHYFTRCPHLSQELPIVMFLGKHYYYHSSHLNSFKQMTCCWFIIILGHWHVVDSFLFKATVCWPEFWISSIARLIYNQEKHFSICFPCLPARRAPSFLTSLLHTGLEKLMLKSLSCPVSEEEGKEVGWDNLLWNPFSAHFI